MDLDELLDYTDDLKKYIKELSYSEDDVRKSFFGIIYSGVYDYYSGHVFYQLAKFIENGNIKFDSSIYNFNRHAKRIYEIANHPYLTQGHFNDLNRNLFLDSWTAFEHSISLLFDFFIDVETKKKLVEEVNSKILKICKDLNQESLAQLTDELYKITFIPTVRKFKFLSKRLDGCYAGDYKKDVTFLEFLSKLRNCTSHSNGLYHGKDFSFEMKGVSFIFKDNEILEMQGINDEIFIEIVNELIQIFKNILNCLRDEDFIQYPEDEQ